MKPMGNEVCRIKIFEGAKLPKKINIGSKIVFKTRLEPMFKNYFTKIFYII